jgi:CubicO group peptidase (beta-lactamase class C family)
LTIIIKTEAQKSKSRATKANSASSSNLHLQMKLDSIFSSFNKTTPGIAINVLQNGKVIAKKASGLVSLEYNAPNLRLHLPLLPLSGALF